MPLPELADLHRERTQRTSRWAPAISLGGGAEIVCRHDLIASRHRDSRRSHVGFADVNVPRGTEWAMPSVATEHLSLAAGSRHANCGQEPPWRTRPHDADRSTPMGCARRATVQLSRRTSQRAAARVGTSGACRGRHPAGLGPSSAAPALESFRRPGLASDQRLRGTEPPYQGDRDAVAVRRPTRVAGRPATSVPRGTSALRSKAAVCPEAALRRVAAVRIATPPPDDRPAGTQDRPAAAGPMRRAQRGVAAQNQVRRPRGVSPSANRSGGIHA